MEQPLFVESQSSDNKGLDFQYLRREGIQLIQKLTGAFWTDYNAHDPGITILEQLCYAITDVCYRIEFDIQDHLFDAKAGSNIFRTAYELLPAHPWTINDYRKIVLDAVIGLKNVWLLPVADTESSFKGLYKILVEIDESTGRDITEESIIQNVRKVFLKNRNLCEDLEKVEIVTPFNVSLHGDIEVDKLEDLERTIAEIYYQVNHYLSPEIHFHTLEELLEKGESVNDLLDGPLLQYGFIKTDDLSPKMDKITLSDIIKVVMQVKGVNNVKNLYIEVDGEKYDNQYIIPLNKIPVLDIKKEYKEDAYNINFFKGTLLVQNMRHEEVDRKYTEIESLNKRVYHINENTLEVEYGKKLKVKEYYSLQNHFPGIFGVGEEGIPGRPDNKRIAQAKQLKAYLILFEQLLANILAQLAHVKELYSNTNEAQQTYFYQHINKNIPNATDLFKTGNHKIDDPVLEHYDITANYKEGIEALIKVNDDYVDRRNRFIDFILAIYGENYNNYTVTQQNYYYTEANFQKFLLKSKIRFLHFLVDINQNKSKAYNYKQPFRDTENISSLEKKVNILLGLGFGLGSDLHYAVVKKSLIERVKKQTIKLTEDTLKGSDKNTWESLTDITRRSITETSIEENFAYVDDEDITLEALEDEKAERLLQETSIIQGAILPAYVLREGINLLNYRIGKLPQSRNYQILLLSPTTGQWIWIAEVNNYQDTVNTVGLIADFLKDYNILSEGLHAIEHLLLRPKVGEEKFGIYIKDEEGFPFLASQYRFTLEERIKVVEQLRAEIRTFENFSVERRTDGDFEIIFGTQDPRMKFTSIQQNISVEAIHNKLEALYKYLSDHKEAIPFEEKVAYYIQFTEDGRKIHEDFFNHRMSFILPNWTVRFHDEEFRRLTESMIQQNKPANVSTQCVWLNLSSMRKFEQLFFNWTQEREKVEDSDKLKELSYQLLDLLYKEEVVKKKEE